VYSPSDSDLRGSPNSIIRGTRWQAIQSPYNTPRTPVPAARFALRSLVSTRAHAHSSRLPPHRTFSVRYHTHHLSPYVMPQLPASPRPGSLFPATSGESLLPHRAPNCQTHRLPPSAAVQRACPRRPPPSTLSMVCSKLSMVCCG